MPFLKQVAEYLLLTHKDTLENCCVVLPNKRAALYLKQHLAQTARQSLWLPEIISAEEFFTGLSGLNIPEETEQLCLLYACYKNLKGEEAEAFEAFSKWAMQVLQDFNEVDRYLADPEQLYENLRHIREIENWSLGSEQLSKYQQDYLAFMSGLGALYQAFRKAMLNEQKAWQGLMYRMAAEKWKQSPLIEKYRHFFFCGFNALNKAEETILRALHKSGKAGFLWDADAYYLEKPEQEAGAFLRRHMPVLPDARKNEPSQDFRSAKHIDIVSVTGTLGQAMMVKQQLEEWLGKGIPANQIAVVLANEAMLWPVLQQLPEQAGAVNITMEYPLHLSQCYALLKSLLRIQHAHARRKARRAFIYYKDLEALLQDTLFRAYLRATELELDCSALLRDIRKRNLVFLHDTLQEELFGKSYARLKPLLQAAESFNVFHSTLSSLFTTLYRDHATQNASPAALLERECMHRLLNQLTRTEDLLLSYPFFNSFQAYRQLLFSVLGGASVPFSGEPLSGLQIMGILESRSLDFTHLIMVNVNEGILPAGRSNSSFLPNDLKRAFGLPLYSDKDAIYAYHFYRLLQRSECASLLYDSNYDTFGKGERSRFLTQLLLELPLYSATHRVRELSSSFALQIGEKERLICIPKTPERLLRIYQLATNSGSRSGLSPSALIAFKSCSLRFYFRYGTGLKEQKEVEESAESNTMGSILHLSLENLYRDLCGQNLQAKHLEAKKALVGQVVRDSFLAFYEATNISGKNLLQEEVLKVYVTKQIEQDLAWVKRSGVEKKTCRILQLEHELSAELVVEVGGKPQHIQIRGQCDRIDQCGETLRIVDYKSSVSTKDKFLFKDFEHLFGDASSNKQVQLLIYAWLAYKNGLATPEHLQPCIMAFKGGQEEPYVLKSEQEQMTLTPSFFEAFEQALSRFIAGIFNPQHDFEQTEDSTLCEYCAYQSLCLRP